MINGDASLRNFSLQIVKITSNSPICLGATTDGKGARSWPRGQPRTADRFNVQNLTEGTEENEY
jgi:hypothetical protein